MTRRFIACNKFELGLVFSKIWKVFILSVDTSVEDQIDSI